MFTAAVRRNAATCRAVDTDVEKEIKNWLRYAKDRDGGRSRREAHRLARLQQQDQRVSDDDQ